MNIQYLFWTGILLIVFKNPIINLTNKTVQVCKGFLLQRKIKALLNEVTRMLPREQFITVAHIGVAKEIVSPNSVPYIGSGWKHIGDKITFIFCDDKKDKPLVSFWLAEKKIIIWEKNRFWFFCESVSRKVTKLDKKNSVTAENLMSMAKVFSKVSLMNHIKNNIPSHLDPDTV